MELLRCQQQKILQRGSGRIFSIVINIGHLGVDSTVGQLAKQFFVGVDSQTLQGYREKSAGRNGIEALAKGHDEKGDIPTFLITERLQVGRHFRTLHAESEGIEELMRSQLIHAQILKRAGRRIQLRC